MSDQDRCLLVRILLTSMLDWLPALGHQLRGELPGEGGSTTKTRCPTCRGEGRVRRLAVCDRCHGSGEIVVDALTHRELPEDESALAVDEQVERHYARRDADLATRGTIRDTERRRIDAIIDRLERAWGEQPEDPEDVLTRSLRLRDEQWNRGSYHELNQELRVLQEVAPLRYSLVLRHLIHGEHRILSDRLQEHLDETVAWLAARMPKRIIVPSELLPAEAKDSLWRGRRPVHDEHRGQRNALIRGMAAEGQTVGEIAPRFGLSKRAVEMVLARQTAQATGPAA